MCQTIRRADATKFTRYQTLSQLSIPPQTNLQALSCSPIWFQEENASASFTHLGHRPQTRKYASATCKTTLPQKARTSYRALLPWKWKWECAWSGIRQCPSIGSRPVPLYPCPFSTKLAVAALCLRFEHLNLQVRGVHYFVH